MAPAASDPLVAAQDQRGSLQNGCEYCTVPGEPTLGRAYALLEARWDAGERDLETGRRLMFLAWCALAEPTFLTGLEGIDTFRVFNDVFTYFRGTASTEPELLSAVGPMAGLCPGVVATRRNGRRWASCAGRGRRN